MAQTKEPTLIPIASPPRYAGQAPRDQAVLQSDTAYWRRELVYGAPSVVPSTMSVRAHAEAFQPYAARPDRTAYEHVVIWLDKSNYQSRAPIGYSPAQQRARTFGGVSMPYYQAVQAPTIDEVARHFGGVING